METTFTKRNSHGANLKRWREWRGIKQEVLADKIGVSQATLSGYEKKDELEPEVLEKVTKALDIPIEAITELNEGTSINIFSGTWQDNASGNVQNQTFNPIDKIVELYERLLKAEQEKVATLMDKMKKFRNDSYAEINRYKREIGTLKTVLRSYVVQIDSLNQLNQKLLAENKEVKKQMDWVCERNKTLEKKTEKMEETLEKANTLAVENFHIYPINKRDKETTLKKCFQLKADFTISRNITAKRGPRMIYLRITRPDGEVLAASSKSCFKFQNASLTYSARREITYEGEKLDVAIYWPNDGSLTKGEYVADLFSDNQQIGSLKFILK